MFRLTAGVLVLATLGGGTVGCGGVVDSSGSGSSADVVAWTGGSGSSAETGESERGQPAEAEPETEVLTGTVLSTDTPEPEQPGLTNPCECPTDVDYHVTIEHPDGRLVVYDLPPPRWAASSCDEPQRPIGQMDLCNGEPLAIGACHAQEGCVELRATGQETTLNLWSHDRGSVRTIWKNSDLVEAQLSGTKLVGYFGVTDESGWNYSGRFVVCSAGTSATEKDDCMR